MLFKKSYSSIAAFTVVLLLSGCAHQSAVTIKQSELATPEKWAGVDKITLADHDKSWLKQTLPPEVVEAIELALVQNHQLNAQALNIESLKQSALASGATLWPSLNLGFNNSRRHSAVTDSYSTSHELSLSLSYEVDIWGKLSANDRQANLQLASQQAQFEQAKQDLISNVILGWYQVVEANQQLSLSQKRLANSKQNLAIIESGYESGLNSALDVYLTRNAVATETSRVATQQSATKAAVRQLELLLGKYPAAALTASDTIPELPGSYNAGVPSEVIANKPSLQASWLSLMASDAGLAYAHKQRFPSLSLTASVGTSSAELGDLLSESIGWSLIGNLTQPLFNAGRLKANEEKARFDTKRAEQNYLSGLNQAFADVENRLTKETNLEVSYLAYQQAAENADLAEQLSFEQYLKGLVSYTTVLDAQTRAFNAQSSLIQAKYQTLENRIQLHLALGGNFNSILSNGSN
jgi:NodT family efflux transporter outer membrane factor (OMF) lipoprotein